MEIEPVDVEYWCSVKTLTVWQAAFLSCDIEPWEEPISTNRKVPAAVEKMRLQLLTHIPHFQTGETFTPGGWSCKPTRPQQLSGDYFAFKDVKAWMIAQLNHNVPAVFKASAFLS